MSQRKVKGTTVEEARSLLRDGALFSLAPALGLLSPLLVLPLITSGFGLQSWAAVVLGSTIGVAGGVFIEFGWPLAAIELVGGQPQAVQRRRYCESLVSRLYVFGPTALCCTVLTYLVVPEQRLSACIACIASCVGGLSATWFYAATGQAKALVRRETALRVTSGPIGALVSVLSSSIIWWPSLQAVAAATAVWLASRPLIDGKALLRTAARPRLVLSQLSTLRAAALLRTGSAVLLAIPTVVVAQIAPAVLSSYSAQDRLSKVVVSGFVPALQALQSRTFTPNGSRKSRGLTPKHRSIAFLIVAIGVLAGLAYVVVFPIFTKYVIRDPLTTSRAVVIAFAALSALAFTSRGLQLVLMRSDRMPSAALLVTIIVSCVLSTGTGSYLFGLFGGVVGALVAEVILLAGVVVNLRLTRRGSH